MQSASPSAIPPYSRRMNVVCFDDLVQPLFEGGSYLLTILVLSRLSTWRRPLKLRARISAAVTTVASELPTPLITIVGLLSSFKTFAAEAMLGDTLRRQ